MIQLFRSKLAKQITVVFFAFLMVAFLLTGVDYSALGSSSAIGKQAAPVYPHFPMTVCARDIGTPNESITTRIVDRFTWVQSHSDTSWTSRPMRDRTDRAMRGHPSSFTSFGYFSTKRR